MAPPPKSCKHCPSFMTAEQSLDRFPRSTGSPMCGRYGKVLGRPTFTDSQERELQRTIAESCSEYGQPMPPALQERDSYVMLPNPELRDTDKLDPALNAACTTCAMCSNLVQESAVSDELGWTAALCAAKGKLIHSNRMSAEASDCEYRQFGPTLSTTNGLHFMPIYADGFGGGAASPVQAILNTPFVEPSEYPTDKPVSTGEETAGIRAWRKVLDPDNTGNEIFFPVYDPSFFDDDQRQLIPRTGSDEHPELYVDHFGGLYGLGVAWMGLDETPVFWGMPGVGKTELLRYAAWIMQLPFHRISFTASSEVDDILGKYEYEEGKGTWFRMGRLAKAWMQPGVLCLDEPNTAPPEVWQAVRPLTDNSKQLVLDIFDGKPLDRHSDCYMGMAMNPPWDARNIGALEIADADANRLFHTYIDMPPAELEKQIIGERVKLDGWELTKDQLDSLMKTAVDIRALSEDDKLPITWAIRPQIKVARALRWFSPTTAYRRAAGDALEPKALQVLLDQVRAHFPSGD